MEPLTPPESVRPTFAHEYRRNVLWEMTAKARSGMASAAVSHLNHQADPLRSPSRGRTRNRAHLPPVLTLSIAHQIKSPVPRYQRSTFSPLSTPVIPPSDDELIFPMSPIIGQTSISCSTDKDQMVDFKQKSSDMAGLDMRTLATIWKGYERIGSRGRQRTRRGRRRSSATAPRNMCVTSPVGIPIKNYDHVTKFSRYDQNYFVERENAALIKNQDNFFNSYTQPFSPSSPEMPFMYSFPILESSFLEKAGHWRATKNSSVTKSDSKQSLLTAQLLQHGFSCAETKKTTEANDRKLKDNDDTLLSTAFQSTSLEDDKQKETLLSSTSTFSPEAFFSFQDYNYTHFKDYGTALPSSLLSSFPVLRTKTISQPKPSSTARTYDDSPLESYHAEEDNVLKDGMRPSVIGDGYSGSKLFDDNGGRGLQL